MQVVEESRNIIGSNIKSKVMNMSIKRNVENLLLRLKPVSIALDSLKNTCSISEAVNI
jgi:hypothetical protein